MFELVDKRVFLQLVALLDACDLPLRVFAQDPRDPLLFDHFLVDEGGERNLDLVHLHVHVESVFVFLKNVRALPLQNPGLRQQVVALSVYFD